MKPLFPQNPERFNRPDAKNIAEREQRIRDTILEGKPENSALYQITELYKLTGNKSNPRDYVVFDLGYFRPKVRYKDVEAYHDGTLKDSSIKSFMDQAFKQKAASPVAAQKQARKAKLDVEPEYARNLIVGAAGRNSLEWALNHIEEYAKQSDRLVHPNSVPLYGALLTLGDKMSAHPDSDKLWNRWADIQKNYSHLIVESWLPRQLPTKGKEEDLKQKLEESIETSAKHNDCEVVVTLLAERAAVFNLEVDPNHYGVLTHVTAGQLMRQSGRYDELRTLYESHREKMTEAVKKNRAPFEETYTKQNAEQNDAQKNSPPDRLRKILSSFSRPAPTLGEKLSDLNYYNAMVTAAQEKPAHQILLLIEDFARQSGMLLQLDKIPAFGNNFTAADRIACDENRDALLKQYADIKAAFPDAKQGANLLMTRREESKSRIPYMERATASINEAVEKNKLQTAIRIFVEYKAAFNIDDGLKDHFVYTGTDENRTKRSLQDWIDASPEKEQLLRYHQEHSDRVAQHMAQKSRNTGPRR
jgi:hypothetical protein